MTRYYFIGKGKVPHNFKIYKLPKRFVFTILDVKFILLINTSFILNICFFKGEMNELYVTIICHHGEMELSASLGQLSTEDKATKKE